MLAFGLMVLCTTLHGAAAPRDVCAERSTGLAQSSGTRVPPLSIDMSQREAVRAAAAPYRGSSIRIVVHRPTPAYTAFARGLAQALEAAAITVSLELVDDYAEADCAQRPGLQIMYGIARSGAVNAIAEAMIRSRIVTESIGGCSVVRENEFTFILSTATS